MKVQSLGNVHPDLVERERERGGGVREEGGERGVKG